MAALWMAEPSVMVKLSFRGQNGPFAINPPRRVRSAFTLVNIILKWSTPVCIFQHRSNPQILFPVDFGHDYLAAARLPWTLLAYAPRPSLPASPVLAPP